MKNDVALSPTAVPWREPVEAGAVARHSAYESFVDERVVGLFLDIARRRVLEMARNKDIPAHPIGRKRKTWRFRISEIDAHFRLRGSRQAVAPISTEELQERKEAWVQ